MHVFGWLGRQQLWAHRGGSEPPSVLLISSGILPRVWNLKCRQQDLRPRTWDGTPSIWPSMAGLCCNAEVGDRAKSWHGYQLVVRIQSTLTRDLQKILRVVGQNSTQISFSLLEQLLGLEISKCDSSRRNDSGCAGANWILVFGGTIQHSHFVDDGSLHERIQPQSRDIATHQ